MNNKLFKASNWLLTKENSQKASKSQHAQSSTSSDSRLSDFCNLKQKTAHQSLLQQSFVPGWKGDSLFSQNAKTYLDTLKVIHQDVIHSFNRINLNKKLKTAIFEEFMSYAEEEAINFGDIDDHATFWNELQTEDSSNRHELERFVSLYSFKVANIYLLKLRFIKVLSDSTNTKFNTEKLQYLNSFLTSIFRSGSSTELKVAALEKNIFSWYSPSQNIELQLCQYFDCSNQLLVTEIVKHSATFKETISGKKSQYSHALSHKNFGLFLNSQLINFPIWMNSFSSRFSVSHKPYNSNFEVISSKFTGDFLESISLSHWLAQENNKDIKWNEIICPDFKGEVFENGLYTKIFNQLQFLTFLASISNNQGQEPIRFISETMNNHFKNRKNSSSIQKSLLLNESENSKSTYDRIILNLVDLPKSNTQHYMISKLINQIDDLKDDGLVFLISSKKLFVPSLKQKIKTLRKFYKLESIIDLSEVSCKGEVGSYIHVFSKVKTFDDKVTKKQVFMNFIFKGELECFSSFSDLTKLLQNFYKSNLSDVPAIFHREFNKIELNFYQDAIIDGRLVHSSNKESNQITHPRFFQNLMNSCLPFDAFFELNQIDEQKEFFDSDQVDFFGDQDSDSTFPFVAIVDMRSKNNSTKVELIKGQTLEAKIYEYGRSNCFYFGITPKWPNISMNSISEFFKTSIGKQIIELTFNNKNRNIKTNFSKLLMPKFICLKNQIPGHISEAFKLLKYSKDDILNTHPNALKENFDQVERLIINIAQKYPGEVGHALAVFNITIENALKDFEDQSGTTIPFNNPLIKSPLVLSTKKSIFPHNPDIFTEFNNPNNAQQIHSKLQSVKIATSIDDGIKNFKLQLFSSDELILSIYSDIEMIKFLDFIFSNAIGHPISSLLKAISAPSLDDLKSIIQSYESMKKVLEVINQKSTPIFEKILSQYISQV